ncbi:hypothetical protein Tco_0617479 [Tanacetum coccineum]
MRKKFSTPGFSLLQEFILLFSQNYLIGALKLSKSLKFLKARWRFFLALMERTSVFWMFRVSISIPLDQFKYGGIRLKLKMKGYYDAKVRGVSFRPGDFVYRANDASHAEDTGKLGPKWEGPYEVTEALGKGAYKLRDMDGRELPRTWNICNLKKCYL